MKEKEKKISQRDERIQVLKSRLNEIEDKYFGSFCKSIGVSNIRQYEERELRFVVFSFLNLGLLIFIRLCLKIKLVYVFRTQQEREQKRVEFQNQKEQIQSQIDFEVSRVESGM